MKFHVDLSFLHVCHGSASKFCYSHYINLSSDCSLHDTSINCQLGWISIGDKHAFSEFTYHHAQIYMQQVVIIILGINIDLFNSMFHAPKFLVTKSTWTPKFHKNNWMVKDSIYKMIWAFQECRNQKTTSMSHPNRASCNILQSKKCCWLNLTCIQNTQVDKLIKQTWWLK